MDRCSLTAPFAADSHAAADVGMKRAWTDKTGLLKSLRKHPLSVSADWSKSGGILEMPTEMLALILAACSIDTLPILAATSKLIGQASDERRKRIAVLQLPPFETTPYAVRLDKGSMYIDQADISAFASALSSGALPLLVELNLSDNQIGDTGFFWF